MSKVVGGGGGINFTGKHEFALDSGRGVRVSTASGNRGKIERHFSSQGKVREFGNF